MEGLSIGRRDGGMRDGGEKDERPAIGKLKTPDSSSHIYSTMLDAFLESTHWVKGSTGL